MYARSSGGCCAAHRAAACRDRREKPLALRRATAATMTFTSQMKRSSKKSVSSIGTPDDFASLCSCLMLKVGVTKKTTYICRLNLPAKILIKHCCVGCLQRNEFTYLKSCTSNKRGMYLARGNTKYVASLAIFYPCFFFTEPHITL